MMPRVFTIVASMVLATMIVAIASTFTSNKWLLITTALTTIATAILLSDDLHITNQGYGHSAPHEYLVIGL